MKKPALALALLAATCPPATAQDETATFDAWLAEFHADYTGEGNHSCWISAGDASGASFQLGHHLSLVGPFYEVAPLAAVIVPAQADVDRLALTWISASNSSIDRDAAMILRGEPASAEPHVGGTVRIQSAENGAIGVLSGEDRGRVAGWLQFAEELLVRVGGETAAEIRVPLADYRQAVGWCRSRQE